MRYDEAMKDVDKDEWRQAALKEIEALEKKGTWAEVSIASVPSNETILPGTWLFVARGLRMEQSRSIKVDIVLGVIFKWEALRLLLQWWPSALFDSSSSYP